MANTSNKTDDENNHQIAFHDSKKTNQRIVFRDISFLKMRCDARRKTISEDAANVLKQSEPLMLTKFH